MDYLHARLENGDVYICPTFNIEAPSRNGIAVRLKFGDEEVVYKAYNKIPRSNDFIMLPNKKICTRSFQIIILYLLGLQILAVLLEI